VRWTKGDAKKLLCGSESDERTAKKGINMMKVNETHVHAFYEKIKVAFYTIRFAAEGRVNIFPTISSFTYTRQTMSQFGMNFIYVINFSNVQNVLRISIMYVISSLE